MVDVPIGSILVWPQQLGEEFTLDANIDDVQTTITIKDDPPGSAPPPPTPPFTIIFPSYDEKMRVTALIDPLTWTVTRGYDGTTPEAMWEWDTLNPDFTLDTIPVGWEIRHEFDNCFIPCAGGTFAVNATGGDNHWLAPVHTHAVGTIFAAKSYDYWITSHVHLVDYTFENADSGSVIDTIPSPVIAKGPSYAANQWHGHTAQITSAAEEESAGVWGHHHDFIGNIDNSTISYSYNSVPPNLGVYFIQRIA